MIIQARGLGGVVSNVLTFDLSKAFLLTHKVEITYGVSFFYRTSIERVI